MTKHPHVLAVDLGKEREFSGITYLPRQDGSSNGRVKDYSVDVSTDCLLYTSDAADELLCVDLGGRRIIKKKNKTNHPSHLTRPRTTPHRHTRFSITHLTTRRVANRIYPN